MKGSTAMMSYDLALFEQLNEEYRARPVVDGDHIARRRLLLSPTEQEADAVSLEERIEAAAKRQLAKVQRDVEVESRRVLELGCGSGFQSRALLDIGKAAQVTGVDVDRKWSWDHLTTDNLTFLQGDLSTTPLVEDGSVDLVVSHVVFEHVTRPIPMLAKIRDVLVDGGTAWLQMNVYTASNASHRYSEVFFPWPHLLFEDEIVRQFYERHYQQPAMTNEWVNRMTVAHYLEVCRTLGFEIQAVRRKTIDIDVPFYLRFREKLGRYAALDLETSFLTLVLAKRSQTDLTNESLARIDYVAREMNLDAKIRAHQRQLRQARRVAATARIAKAE